ncbi:MAG: hypothetical protein QF805_11800, partial [Pirellulaceae bacterium]|nr:hypothetical protein [Pirellulaceae bacterium]
YLRQSSPIYPKHNGEEALLPRRLLSANCRFIYRPHLPVDRQSIGIACGSGGDWERQSASRRPSMSKY